MAKKQNIAICDGCGHRRPIVARGLCKKCYGNQYRAEQRKRKLVQAYNAVEAIQKVIGTPSEALLDEMFYCNRYHCWMRVQHCLAYYEMAARAENDGVDTGNVLRRDMCLDCVQYDNIVQAVKKNDVAVLKMWGGNNGNNGSNWNNICLSRKLQEEDTIMATTTATVDEKYGMCVDCGKRPASNPISHLCGKCHAAMQVRQRKEKILKTLEMSWFDVAVAQYPELREHIVKQAKKEYRTPELQALYMLDMLMRSIENTKDMKG